MLTKLITLTGIILGLFVITSTAQAEGISESAYLLREAMMQSNADYNKHKKKANHEEFDRADEWGERETSAININSATMGQNDIQDFQSLAKEIRGFNEREVSSNDEQKYQDLSEE